MGALPIDEVLDEVVEAARVGNLVLVAPPGAGKTTRVPRALLERHLVGDRQILVLQPRRLAARLAAERVSEELGEAVGGRCGYQVRFEQAVSARTRLRFITEGLLTRQLREDPHLLDVGAVVFDELHERHLATDLGLALTRRLQQTRRPDLRIVAMSATLAAEPVGAYLGAPVLRSEGRAFPVDIRYLGPSDRPLERQVLRGLSELLEDAGGPLDGHVLVFLPGAREIRRAAEACEPLARASGMEVLPLHGELPRVEQDRAVQPSARPRLILSTNVAETSVTIEGVVAVIDSGLARVATHDPWTGMPRLGVAPVSRASADQRAGRAGRTRAGRCLRLYGQHDFERRPAQDRPEIQRLDLAAPLLDLYAAGVHEPGEFPWLDPPPPSAISAARELLRRLGAIEADGLSDTGRAMLSLPVHPRLARFLVAARATGVGRTGAEVAAVLAEGSPFRATGPALHAADADVLVDVERLRRKDPAADRARAGRIARVARQLERLGPHATDEATLDPDARDERLRVALMLAFSDRVARLRDDGHDRRAAVFATGGSAEVTPASVVREAGLAVVLEVQEQRRVDGRAGRGQPIATSLAAIEADWLLEHFTDEVQEARVVRFDPARERVVAEAQLRWGELVLESTVEQRPAGAEVTRALAEAALAAGPASFVDGDALEQITRRSRFMAEHRAEVPILDDEAARRCLLEACEGHTSFRELRDAGLLDRLLAELGPHRATLERWAPTHVTLPGGRRLAIHYETDRPPWVASRMQDFFGLAEGPRIAEGRVPLVLHLRAPNNRDVQVTTDLSGFWERHYPELARSLRRRYPRHDWPDDPRSASPPSPSGRRRDR